MKRRTRRALALVALVATGLAVQTGVAKADRGDKGPKSHREVVTAKDIGDGWYMADTRDPGTGAFVAGPGTPPLGKGSFEFRTPPGPVDKPGKAKVQLLTDEYNGVPLSDIKGLSYATYRHGAPDSTGGTETVTALNLRVDINGDQLPDRYFVFEPYVQASTPVQSDVWQTWDAINSGNAKWWVSGSALCGQPTPCTWAQLLATFPGATIREGTDFPGSLGFNQGSNNPGIVANADALSVTVGDETTVYDFEPSRPRGRDDRHEDRPARGKND